MDAELGVDVPEVLLHRLARYDEHARRLGNRRAIGHGPQHVQLALGEGIGRRGRRTAGAFDSGGDGAVEGGLLRIAET